MSERRGQHPNAVLTPQGRRRMVRCVLEQRWSVTATAERFQIDPKTVRKWRDRYLGAGEAGLLDRSSRPRRSPNRTGRRLDIGSCGCYIACLLVTEADMVSRFLALGGRMGVRRGLSAMAVVALLVSGIAPAPASSSEGSAKADPDSPYVATLYPQIPNASRPWQNDEDGNRKRLSRAYDAGMRWTYVWVAWSDIEKVQGVYDEEALEQLDDYMRLAYDHGIHVVVQLMVGPWGYPQYWELPYRQNSMKPVLLAPLPSPNIAPLPRDLSGPRRWAEMLVERYKPGGLLAEQEGWGDYGVTRWEIENEPDNGFVWWGTWIDVPKDYAAYLSEIVPAMKSVDPDAVIDAPALSHQEGGPLKGLAWLDEVLSRGESDSEWASDQYRTAGGLPGAGCHIDAFSFHRNNPTLHDKQAALRARAVRELAADHEDDADCPTRKDVELYFSEGGALQYSDNPRKFAWAQAQLMTQLHGVGVDRMVFSPGAEINKDPWSDQPMYKAMAAMATYFPRADQVVSADELIDPERVTAYVRTDPDTGLRTLILWAHTLPPDSPDGEPFSVEVPVRTAQADVVGWDWATERVGVTDGTVTVSVRPGDPSPVVIVGERSE